MERGKQIRGTFVIPVRVDNVSIRPELGEYHVIDGRTERGLEKLASDIRRDYQTRKKTIT